jgi:hypothetical protein
MHLKVSYLKVTDQDVNCSNMNTTELYSIKNKICAKMFYCNILKNSQADRHFLVYLIGQLQLVLEGFIYMYSQMCIKQQKWWLNATVQYKTKYE